MIIQKHVVSRDDSIYEAWPDVTLLPSGRLLCVFAECNHHLDRNYTRIMLCHSDDRGRTWSAKRPITEPTRGYLGYWNCPRISLLEDGTPVILVDKLFKFGNEYLKYENVLIFGDSQGEDWSPPLMTPASGIVPDKLRVLADGSWIITCHYHSDGMQHLVQRAWISSDRGKSWSGPFVVGRQENLKLCEASILEIPETETLVAFHRENSYSGRDCYKTISEDGGLHWSEPIRFPLSGCHRPVAGWLQDGRILITYRFLQGGASGAQNVFGALTDTKSLLATRREEAFTRIFPIDHDRSPHPDLGYTGWVQFPDGEIYLVNYIMDDAPKAQIRGYSFRIEEIVGS